jgi:hypothetical protein
VKGFHEWLERGLNSSDNIWIYLPGHVDGGVVDILGVRVGIEVAVVCV